MRRLLLGVTLVLELGVIAPHAGLSETIGMNSSTFGVFSVGSYGSGAWSGEIQSQGMMMSNGVFYSQGMEIPDFSGGFGAGTTTGGPGPSLTGDDSSGLYGGGGAGVIPGGPSLTSDSSYDGSGVLAGGSVDPSNPFSPTLPGFAGILDGGGNDGPGGVESFNAASFDFHDPDKHDPPPRSVPEPMTLALLGTALLGFRVIRRMA